MLAISCAFIGVCLFFVGSIGNGLCIIVFLRRKFRSRIITPYFIVLLFADSIYLLFRLIKLFYYSQTLFRLHSPSSESCSNTYFARLYQHATQTWPQVFVPLVHSETYIRFSLILMSIMSIQRSKFISRSMKLQVLPNGSHERTKHRWMVFWISLAFIVAYGFEFAGLTLFCSKSSNREITFGWFRYMTEHMDNATVILTNTMINRPHDLKCVENAIETFRNHRADTALVENSICEHEHLLDILEDSFDQHERPIVNLIQKIIYFQNNESISRNEIRRKYHFHECLFPQDPKFFHQNYNFMYSRLFGVNRHTILLGKFYRIVTMIND